MRQLVNPSKALRTLRKTPVILSTLLADVTREQAMNLCDGPDGWSILYIVCHLCDVEALFTQRVRDLLEQTEPIFHVVQNDELIRRGNYAVQDFRAILAEYNARRAAFIDLLTPLTDEQWLRAGMHPEQGPATVLDVAINTGLHDVDHLEQIIRCLAPIRP